MQGCNMNFDLEKNLNFPIFKFRFFTKFNKQFEILMNLSIWPAHLVSNIPSS